MQDHVTPSGKTTIETADSAIMSNITTLRRLQRRQRYGRAPQPQQTTRAEQVTFKRSRTTVESPKDKCFKHFSEINKFSHRINLPPFVNSKKMYKDSLSRTDHRVWVVVCVKWWINIWNVISNKNRYCTRYMLEKNTGSCLSASDEKKKCSFLPTIKIPRI